MRPRKLGYGFGGFPVVPLSKLPARGARRACIFGVDRDLARRFGRNTAGAASFIRRQSARIIPAAVRQQRAEWLQSLDQKVDRRAFKAYDIGILGGEPDQIRNELMLLATELVSRNYQPLMIAGDHSASLWHFAGVSKVRPADYVYIDAHFDLGLHRSNREKTVDHGNFVSRIVDHGSVHVINIGARAWSTYEKVYASQPLEYLRCRSEQQILGDLVAIKNRDIYVSIDADVIDPSHFPNAACPEPFGLEPMTLLRILNYLSTSNRIVGADLCELAPDKTKGHTAEIAMRFLYEMMS